MEENLKSAKAGGFLSEYREEQKKSCDRIIAKKCRQQQTVRKTREINENIFEIVIENPSYRDIMDFLEEPLCRYCKLSEITSVFVDCDTGIDLKGCRFLGGDTLTCLFNDFADFERFLSLRDELFCEPRKTDAIEEKELREYIYKIYNETPLAEGTRVKNVVFYVTGEYFNCDKRNKQKLVEN